MYDPVRRPPGPLDAEEELYGEGDFDRDDRVVPSPIRDTAPDLDDVEAEAPSGAPDPWNLSDGLSSGVGPGGRADCAIVEARYPSGASTSTWIDFPTGGVSNADQLRTLLDEARQPGASEESMNAWRSLIPAASVLPEEVSVRPCGTVPSTAP